MSKRALRKYLSELKKAALEEQILELYETFPQVKKYYDFVFNPKEEKRIQLAKEKISNEYFPVRRKRPRARRSVAQKFIKEFKILGLDPFLLADLMLFNLEIALTFERERKCPTAFYKSMLNSFKELTAFIMQQGIEEGFETRISKWMLGIEESEWEFYYEYEKLYETLK